MSLEYRENKNKIYKESQTSQSIKTLMRLYAAGYSYEEMREILTMTGLYVDYIEASEKARDIEKHKLSYI